MKQNNKLMKKKSKIKNSEKQKKDNELKMVVIHFWIKLQNSSNHKMLHEFFFQNEMKKMWIKI